MKTLPLLFLLPVLLSSCCCGNRKCSSSPSPQRFSIVSAATGDDLVFGPSRIYDKDIIKFYSLEGTDTIIHFYTPGSDTGTDSLLYVSIYHNRKETIYLRLTPADRDTLTLNYHLEERNCCSDYYILTGLAHNHAAIQSNGGVYSIKK